MKKNYVSMFQIVVKDTDLSRCILTKRRWLTVHTQKQLYVQKISSLVTLIANKKCFLSFEHLKK